MSVVSGQGTSAPAVWLIVGVLLTVAAILVAALTSSVWLAVIAWTLGGPVAIGMLAVFTHIDTRRRANPWYANSQLTDWGRRLLVAMSLVAVGVNAWTIADVVARGGF